MDIDFSKQNSLPEKIELVIKLYERFNRNYGDLVNMDLVRDAVKNIIVVNDNLSNVPEEIKDSFIHRALAIQNDGIIYVKKDVSLDLLFHEILHFISKENLGVKYLYGNFYSYDEQMKMIKEMGLDIVLRQIDQLNESITRFITELGIPEIEIVDSYKFGADTIRKYYDYLISKGIDPSFILDMYLNGNQEEFNRFITSFGDRANEFLKAIESQPKDKELTKEEVEIVIDEATDRIKML